MYPRLQLDKRRDKIAIIAEVLEVARPGALKTQILYRVGLSFAQLTHYLRLLMSANLIKKTAQGKKEIYNTTPKGLEFLRKQQEIMNLLGQGAKDKANMKITSEGLVVSTGKEGS